MKLNESRWLPCLFALYTAACSSDDDATRAVDPEQVARPSEPASTGTPSGDAAFAGCSKGTLEADLRDDPPLAGPGVDPSTGVLEAGDYVIASTYLALEPGMQETTFTLAGPVLATLATTPGLVASALASSESCATLRTLTVWESEADMLGFVLSEAHARAMAQIGNVSRGTSNTLSWRAGAEEAGWEAAARRLGTDGDLDR